MNKIVEFLKPYQKIFRYNTKDYLNKIALKNISNCKSVLDIGCGEGNFIGYNPKIITGVDHNERSLEICRKKGYSVKYANVTDIPFKDNYFDAVYCSHVIEHLYPKDAHRLLIEMNRVLKVGGMFIILTPLLHHGCYDDLTHLKPYNPASILHYISIENTKQKTLENIPGLYKKIELKYRRNQIFTFRSDSTFWFLGVFFNILSKFGITRFKRTGYIMVLKKKK